MICSSPIGATTSCTTTMAMELSLTSPRRPAWLDPGTAWGAGCCFLDYDRDGHLDLFVANYVNFDPARAPKPGQCGLLQLQRHSGSVRSARLRRRDEHSLSQSRRRHICRCLRESGIARPRGPSSMVFVGTKLATHRFLRHGSGGRRLRQRRLAGYLRCLRQRSQPALSQQSRWNVPGNRRSRRLRLGREWSCLVRNGRGRGRLSMGTAGWTLRARISPNR